MEWKIDIVFAIVETYQSESPFAKFFQQTKLLSWNFLEIVSWIGQWFVLADISEAGHQEAGQGVACQSLLINESGCI